MTNVILLCSSVLVSFIGTGLKGFQHKNVIHNKQKAMFITTYFMAAVDVICVGLIVKGGWIIALTSGTGAAFGMLFAINLHAKVFKKEAVDNVDRE